MLQANMVSFVGSFSVLPGMGKHTYYLTSFSPKFIAKVIPASAQSLLVLEDKCVSVGKSLGFLCFRVFIHTSPMGDLSVAQQ